MLFRSVTILWVATLYWTSASVHPLPVARPDWSRVEPQVTMCVGVCTLLSFMVFFLGELTDNVSSVDRLWSLVPSLYTAITWSLSPASPRLSLMLAVSLVWSIRLTYNFWRRGGYSWPPWTGCEDYRFVSHHSLDNTHLQVGVCETMASAQHQAGLDAV